MRNKLEKLIASNAAVWHGHQSQRQSQHVPTGFAELDAVLPSGGWPADGLTELFTEQAGIGELRLLAPALAHLSHQGRQIALISPPHTPYAPALEAFGLELDYVFYVQSVQGNDQLWAMEQIMRSGACGALLAWNTIADFAQLRRLVLAARAGQCWTVLFRAPSAAVAASPAALRIELGSAEGALHLHIFKAIGALKSRRLCLSL